MLLHRISIAIEAKISQFVVRDKFEQRHIFLMRGGITVGIGELKFTQTYDSHASN